MKTITFLALIFLSFSFTTSAQNNPATPNSGFESWTHYSANGGYDDPNNWSCLNPTTSGIFGFVTCYKDSTNVHSGKYSVELITMDYNNVELIPGTLTTGTFNLVSQTIVGGIPYTYHPDSIVGWYEYTSVSGDNGDCEFYLFGRNHLDTIGEAFFKTPTHNVTAWTRFSYPITYRNSNAFDTAEWIFTSSLNPASGHQGSILYLDDIGLTPMGLSVDNLTNSEKITVGPNPTSGFVSIKNSATIKSLLFTLTDVTGRKVEEEKIASGTTLLQLAGVAEGIYIYCIQDEQNTVIKTGKILVQ